MITYIGFYTEEYTDVLKSYLLPTLIKFDLQYKIYSIESVGNWNKNTNLKPLVIEKAFQDFDTDLVVLDVDCKILDVPKFHEIPKEYDMALHFLEREKWFKQKYGPNDQIEALSGTLFFRNRPICKKFIKEWKKNALYFGSSRPDQSSLKNVLRENKEIKVYNLPIEFCYIHDLPGGVEPGIPRPNNIIIEHFAASRELRRKIK